MRISKSILLAAIAVVVLATGCAGPEQKLGDNEFAWRFQRWRSIYFKRLRATGTRKQRLKAEGDRSAS